VSPPREATRRPDTLAGEQQEGATAAESVRLAHRGPRQLVLFPDPDPPMESDPDRGVWFWRSGSGESIRTLSSHPHPRLPHHCPIHRTYSDRPCNADHSPEAIVNLLEHRARPVKRGGHVRA
jgi:hypothetical protein